MGIDERASSTASACPDPSLLGDLLVGRIAEVRAWLSSIDPADLTDRDRIRVVSAVEELAGAGAGVQARMTAAYADSQRSLGCSVRGVAAEVGLARRVGLSRAARLVAGARVLVDDLPETLDHLESGRLSEIRAVQVAGQVADLEPAERQEVDAMIAEDLPRLGDAEVRDAVDAAVTRIDPAAVEQRRRTACRRRRVTVQAGADGMAWLSIHTTAIEAAAALNTLHAHADSVLAGTGGLGDVPEQPEGRGHAELMADAALSRLTGRSVHQGPPVEVQLVMTDTALLPPRVTTSVVGGSPTHAGDAVARVVGVGPVPAGVARDLIRHHPPASPAARSVDATPSGVGRGRMFEGPDWDLDDRPPEQRQQPSTDDWAGWRPEDREAGRVTVRRVHLSHDGRNPIAIDARRRLMPLAAREAISRRGDGPPRDDGPGPGRRPNPVPAAEAELHAWLARLRAPARPDELASLRSPQRCARGLLRHLVVLRDQRCRVPWCTAPIRHVDHVTPHRDRPVTDAAGLAGACIGHNLAKEDPGHNVAVTDDGLTGEAPHTLAWTTPTGHTHTGIAPPVLGWCTDGDGGQDHLVDDARSPLETHLMDLLAA